MKWCIEIHYGKNGHYEEVYTGYAIDAQFRVMDICKQGLWVGRKFITPAYITWGYYSELNPEYIGT